MDIQKLIIEYDVAPTSVEVTVCNEKFNKNGVFMYQVDDNNLEGLNDAINYWAENNFHTNDNCGNNIPFIGDLGVVVGLGDPNIPNDPDYRAEFPKIPDLKALIAKGGAILDHSKYHNNDNPLQQVIDMRAKYLSVLNYVLTGIIVPGAETTFGDVAIATHDQIVTSEGDRFGALNPYRFHKIAPPFPILPCLIPLGTATIASSRDNNDYDNSSATDYGLTQIDALFNGQRNYWILFSHRGLQVPAEKAQFVRLFSHFKDFSNYSDHLLMCSMREWVEYRLSRMATVSHQLNGRFLTITFDLTTIPDIYRQEISWNDKSIIADVNANIVGIQTENFQRTSFNNQTGLVNGFHRNTVWGSVIPDPDPEPDPQPQPSGSFYAGLHYYI